MILDPAQKTEKRFIDKVVPFLSVVIPGSGQIALKKTWRGITILVMTLILGFLVNWAYVKFKIGKIQINDAQSFTWLVIPLVLFYLWNILDATLLAKNKKSSILIAVLSAAIILYVIGWSVTGVKMDRLITRFADARTVMNRLVNPDLFSTHEGDKIVVCSWGCLMGLFGFQN